MPEMRRIMKKLTATVCCLSLSACAAFGPAREPPTVTLSSLRALPTEGLTPEFEVQLNILNTNPEPLVLQGVVYTISLESHELVKGAGTGFPEIAPYSDETITLTARANLLSGVRMIWDLMEEPAETLDYSFEARLDLAGLQPSVRVTESGTLDMNRPRTR